MVNKMINNMSRKNAADDAQPAFDPIDAALRQLFVTVESEQVPDDFNDLVSRFAQKHERNNGDAQ